MADEPTTPPNDDDTGVDATDATEATEATTELPRTEPAAAVPVADAPVADAPSHRWSPDRRSVVVTLVAVAALAGSFGLGWAAGAANDDDDDARRVGHMQRFERGGPPGGGAGMSADRQSDRGGDRGERPGGFDRGFDGPRGRGEGARMSMRGGVVGTITKVDGDTLTIDAIGPEGSGSTQVELDDDVEVVVRGGGERDAGSRDDLEPGVMIAAHGDSGDGEDDDAIDADRIVVLRVAE